MLGGPEGGVASPGPFTAFIRDVSNANGILVDRGGGMEQVEGVSELDTFRAVFLADDLNAEQTSFISSFVQSNHRPWNLALWGDRQTGRTLGNR